MKTYSNKWLIVSTFTLFTSISSCQTESKKGFGDISTKEVKALLEKKTPATIIDIRTPEEVMSTGKIPGCHTINFYDPDFKTKINTLPKDKPVYVYCAAGGRSTKSLKVFEEAGFTEAYSMKGGMGKWLSLKYPVE